MTSVSSPFFKSQDVYEESGKKLHLKEEVKMKRLTETKVNSQFLQAVGQAPQEDLLAVSPQGLLSAGQFRENCTRAHFSKGATFTCDVSWKR